MVVALSLMALGLGAGVVKSFEPANRRPAYADVADFVNANVRTGDVVVQFRLYPGIPSEGVDIHLDPSVRTVSPGAQASVFRTAKAQGGRIFYIRPEVSNPPSLDPSLRSAYRLSEQRTWQGLVPLTVQVFAPTAGS